MTKILDQNLEGFRRQRSGKEDNLYEIFSKSLKKFCDEIDVISTDGETAQKSLSNKSQPNP